MKYIGFDLGDGESCVTFLTDESMIEPRIVPIAGKLSFLSAVARGADGVLIGDEALANDDMNEFSVRFKSRFLESPDAAGIQLGRFARGVYERLRAAEELDGALVSVGCPAGWDDEARTRYLRILRDAGFTQARLVSESRAAFLYAKHARAVRLDPALLDDSALVIDIGSSTLDFAFVEDGRERGVGTFGNVYLGGGAIDEAILDASVRAMPANERRALELVFAQSPGWRGYCLLAARRVKERYYTREADDADCAVEDTVGVYYDEPIRLPIRLTKQFMGRMIQLPLDNLGGKSFCQCLTDALTRARLTTAHRPPKLVMLTGGASHMRFFRALCAEIFTNATVICSPEPEFSVARGLAYSGRVDARLRAFREAVDAFVASGEVERLVVSRVPGALPAIADALSERALGGAIVPAFEAWRTGETNALADLQKDTEARLTRVLGSEETRAALSELLTRFTGEICGLLQARADELCETYGVPREQMLLLNPTGRVGPAPRYTAGDLPYLHAAATVAVGAMAAAICGGSGIALIAAGVPGMVAGFAAGAAAMLLGKKGLQKLLRGVPYPVFMRKLLPVSALTAPRQKKKLADSLLQSMEQNGEFAASLSRDVSREVGEYLQSMAKRAEIPIR